MQIPNRFKAWFTVKGLTPANRPGGTPPTVPTPPSDGSALPVLIFLSTRSARPGQAINLTGEFSAQAQVQLRTFSDPTWVPLPAATDGVTTVQMGRNVTVRIPSTRPMDVYQVRVVDQGKVSQPVLVNQAWPQYLNCDQASKGATVQLVGKNLQLTPGLFKLKLAPVNGGANVDITGLVNIPKSTARRVQFTLPTSGPAVDTSYRLVVENGYGPAVVCDETLTILGSGNDSFNISQWVPWAGKFDFAANRFNAVTRQDKDAQVVLPQAVSTSATNNAAAINANIEFLKGKGGAVLSFPAGEYWSTPITMASDVILAGPGKIRITGNVPGGGFASAFEFPDGTSRSGLVDVLYDNGATASDLQGYGNLYGNNCSDILLKGCVFDQHESEWLQLLNSRRVALIGNRLNQGINRNSRPYQRGPLRVDGSSYVIGHANYFDFCVDGINAIHTNHVFWSGNTFFWQASLGNLEDAVNHVLIQGHSDKWCVFGKNLFTSDEAFEVDKNMTVLKRTGKPSNDAEKIIGEFTGEVLQKVRAIAVSSATVNSVSYANLMMPDDSHYSVAVVAGKGLGQERKVLTRTSTKTTIEGAWDVVPDATSTIVIHVSGVNDFLIEDNDFELGKRGPTLYWTPLRRGAIIGNRTRNGGSIDNTPVLQGTDVPDQWLFCSQWDMEVEDNVSTHETDAHNGCFIGIHAVQSRQNRTVGALVLGYVCRNNRLTARRPNVAARVDTDYPNGFINQCEWQPDGRPFIGDAPAVIGSIFEDNTATNCHRPLKMGWAHNTYIKNLTVAGQVDAQYQADQNTVLDDGMGQNLPSVNTLRLSA